MLESLLIANRGEIARRIIRTARRLAVKTIAVYSDADAAMPFVREADVVVALGGMTLWTLWAWRSAKRRLLALEKGAPERKS